MLSTFILLVYTYGLGYSFTRFIKNSNFETHIIRIAVGLAAIPVIAIILNCFKIPIDWRILLFLSILTLIYDIKKGKLPFKFSRPQTHTIILIIIFIIQLYIYHQGAFKYPWLEDDDPWYHAAGAQYIAFEKNIFPPFGFFQYLTPYPPGYDVIMGIFYQINGSLSWTLKFFNNLIISLGYLFFYFFVKLLSNDRRKALWSTFFLFVLPSYLTHFIWAHSLLVTLFFPAFYLTIKAIDDKKFVIPASFVITAIFLTQPTEPIKFIIMLFLLLAAYAICHKKIPGNIFRILLFSLILILPWLILTIKQVKAGAHIVVRGCELNTAKSSNNNFFSVDTPTQEIKINNIEKIKDFIGRLLDPKNGSGTREYDLTDFLLLGGSDRIKKIDNSVGIGLILCPLTLLGLIIHVFNVIKKKYTTFNLTSIFWFIFTFLGVNSMTFHLPIGLFAYRFWMLLAVAVSILSAEAIVWLINKFRIKVVKTTLVIGVIIMSCATSGFEKLYINTSIWPPGVCWAENSEIIGYSYLRNYFSANAKVFSYINNMFVIGFDMRSDFYSPQYENDFKKAIELSAESFAVRLKNNNYEGIIIGQREVLRFGENMIKIKIDELKNSPHFQLLNNYIDKVWIFKVSSTSTDKI